MFIVYFSLPTKLELYKAVIFVYFIQWHIPSAKTVPGSQLPLSKYLLLNEWMDTSGQYIYSSVPTRWPATCCLLALWESHTYSLSSLTSYHSVWGSHWWQTLRSSPNKVRVQDGLVQAAYLLLVAGQVRKLVQNLGSSGSQEAVNRKLRPGVVQRIGGFKEV